MHVLLQLIRSAEMPWWNLKSSDIKWHGYTILTHDHIYTDDNVDKLETSLIHANQSINVKNYLFIDSQTSNICESLLFVKISNFLNVGNEFIQMNQK